MNTVEKIQDVLDTCKSCNGGIGLVVHPNMAKELRNMGIDGPFHVSCQIPKIKIKSNS